MRYRIEVKFLYDYLTRRNYLYAVDIAGEQLLLERIRASDESAFKLMHEQFYSPLYKLALKKLGDEDEVYDLLQEMFLELWEKRDSFIISNPLFNYLKNRLWFKLAAHFRKKGFQEKHLTSFTAFLQHDAEIAPAADELLEMELQYDLLMSRVEDAVQRMPEKMKAVFLLSRTGEYSVKEIASRLGLSPKTVSNHIHMGLDRIRRSLADQGLSVLEILVLIWLTKN